MEILYISREAVTELNRIQGWWVTQWKWQRGTVIICLSTSVEVVYLHKTHAVTQLEPCPSKASMISLTKQLTWITVSLKDITRLLNEGTMLLPCIWKQKHNRSNWDLDSNLVTYSWECPTCRYKNPVSKQHQRNINNFRSETNTDRQRTEA